jgi:hypothetical protein
MKEANFGDFKDFDDFEALFLQIWDRRKTSVLQNQVG